MDREGLSSWGSSPLTRGKHTLAGPGLTMGRLIPAHAGKTLRAARDRRAASAHPRSRGENWTFSRPKVTPLGSSPLTRGKLPHRGSGRKAGRLIPAHAGKIGRGGPEAVRHAAHPRSRGENAMWIGGGQNFGGSSPLTRGKHVGGVPLRTQARLIPAHAGKTLPDLRFYCADRSDLGNP